MMARTALVKGLCIRKPGGCTTTALAMHGFGGNDPLLTMLIDNVLGFVEGAMQQRDNLRIIQRAWDKTVQAMPEAAKWATVNGPMSSAIATLTDLGWKLIDLYNWQSPDGDKWILDFTDPLLPDLLREVLQVHCSRHIWSQYASKHFAGTDALPDLTAYKKLRKALRARGEARQLYFLESIVQGAAVGITDAHICKSDDRVPICRHCGQVVTGCSFQHFSYFCSATCCLEIEEVEATSHITKRAQGELDSEENLSLWLRGLPPLSVPDPLEPNYKFTSSFSQLNVTGKVLAGDGSGGLNSKDFRARRCGFGLAVLHPRRTE